jgi:cytochrome c-type biogenesis protein CcmF
VLAAFGMRHFYALISFGLCAFVAVTIGMEYFKGAWAIHQRDKLSLPFAMVELFHRNTRRYGGYLVHMGIVIMFIGYTGAAFNQDKRTEVKIGDSFTVGAYTLKVKEIRESQTANHLSQHAVIAAFKNGEFVADLEPERRLFKAGEGTQPTSYVAIRRRLHEDLYLNFAAMSQSKENHALIDAYIFPLVSCVWAGFWVLLLGTVVCLIPAKQRLSYLKTQVVGTYAKEPAPAK